MGRRDSGHTRRRLLGVAAGATLGATALTGCGVFDPDPTPEPEPDPLQPLLDEALALAAAYDRAGVAQPDLAGRLAPLAADHRAHATELTKVIGAKAVASGSPSAGPSASAGPDTGATTLADLRTAERNAQRTATTSARTVPADRAALVGSIAACRATHAEALK